MKDPSCGVTFVLLHVGHLILAFSLSEMVMVSSNGFSHFSHMNSYLGMVTSPIASSPGSMFECRVKIRMRPLGIQVAGPVAGNELPSTVSFSAPGQGARTSTIRYATDSLILCVRWIGSPLSPSHAVSPGTLDGEILLACRH